MLETYWIIVKSFSSLKIFLICSVWEGLKRNLENVFGLTRPRGINSSVYSCILIVQNLTPKQYSEFSCFKLCWNSSDIFKRLRMYIFLVMHCLDGIWRGAFFIYSIKQILLTASEALCSWETDSFLGTVWKFSLPLSRCAVELFVLAKLVKL